jgi:hypothetical protein
MWPVYRGRCFLDKIVDGRLFSVRSTRIHPESSLTHFSSFFYSGSTNHEKAIY